MTLFLSASPTGSSTPGTQRRARRALARASAAIAVTGGLLFAAPIAAHAHVGVTPDTAEPGASSVLTFAFSHGCAGSPTTALEFEIPDGVSNVAPTVQAGWTIDVERAENDSVQRIVYTADQPIEDHMRATVSMSARFSPETAETSVAFPVVQHCVEGESAWVEVGEGDAADAHDELESPAPVVAVGAATAGGAGNGHDHGSTDGAGTTDGADSEHATHEGEDATEESAASADASESSPWPLVVGAAGLVVGAAAFVIAVAAFRRRA